MRRALCARPPASTGSCVAWSSEAPRVITACRSWCREAARPAAGAAAIVPWLAAQGLAALNLQPQAAAADTQALQDRYSVLRRARVGKIAEGEAARPCAPFLARHADTHDVPHLREQVEHDRVNVLERRVNVANEDADWGRRGCVAGPLKRQVGEEEWPRGAAPNEGWRQHAASVRRQSGCPQTRAEPPST
eukprot:CAMPEP_0180075922 /NCGR_PEP_ID=MMETSP0985-20121206/14813_1 /TAXON_ID=483367 /ORGANISM="non described non described, Strain CCMP 2436" /LENGTH=190 /DNA_ID=CAMNT_0022008003 /DNA_START=394 /DNA_END=964 /DNA_ORIENTATION=+